MEGSPFANLCKRKLRKYPGRYDEIITMDNSIDNIDEPKLQSTLYESELGVAL